MKQIDILCIKRVCMIFGALDGVSADFEKNKSKGKLVSIVGYANTNQAFTVIFFFIRIGWLKKQ